MIPDEDVQEHLRQSWEASAPLALHWVPPWKPDPPVTPWVQRFAWCREHMRTLPIEQFPHTRWRRSGGTWWRFTKTTLCKACLDDAALKFWQEIKPQLSEAVWETIKGRVPEAWR